MVQNFVSDSGTGMEMVMIQVRTLPEPYNRELTEEEKREIISRDMVSEFAPGGNLLSYEVTKIDGEPCAMVETEQINERVGFKIGQKILTFVVPRKGAILCVQCSVGGDAENGFQSIRQRYEEAKPLLLLMASSCVLSDKWQKSGE